jgi:hypothetical protein
LIVSIPYIATMEETIGRRRRMLRLIAAAVVLVVGGLAILFFVLPPLDLVFDKLLGMLAR